MALTNATTLADYGAGIGTQGATLKVDATNKRVGVGTDSPAGPEGSLQVGTGITFFGNTGIVSAIGGKFSGDFTVGGTLTYEDVANIDAVGIITAQSGVSIADSIFHTGDTNTAIRFPGNDTFTVETSGSEALRIDGSQRLLMGRTSTAAAANRNSNIQLHSNDASEASITIRRFFVNTDDNAPPRLILGRSGSNSDDFTIVADGNRLGEITFAGADGTDLRTEAANIRAEVDGTPGSNDMPGRLIFSTTADGASDYTERLRIDSSGQVGIGTDNPSALLHVENNAANAVIARFESNMGTNNSRAISIKSPVSDSASEPFIFDTGNAFEFQCDSTSALHIKFNRNIGIGTDDPSRLLELAQTNSTAYSTTDFDKDYHVLKLRNYTSDKSVGMQFLIGGNGEAAITAHEEDADGDTTLAFGVRNSGSRAERMRIDSSGRLLLGATSSAGSARLLQIAGTSSESGLSATRYINDAGGAAAIDLAKSRNGTIGSQTVVQSGDALGYLQFRGSDGTNQINAANIKGEVDGTPGSNDMPGRLVFSTTADGASSPTERLRIDSGGRLLVNGTSSTSPDGFDSLIQVNADNHEGSITIGRHTANGNGPALLFQKSRSGTATPGNGVVSDGDTLGTIRFYGSDGTDRNSFAANIGCEVDGTPGSNDMPGALTFSTTADGSASSTERLRITSEGELLISNSGNRFLSLDRTNASSGTGEFNVNVESDSQASILYDDGASLVIGTSSTPRTQAGFTERLRIDSSGNLKLGDTTLGIPASGSPPETFFVGRKAAIRSVTVTTTLDSSGDGTFDLGRIHYNDDESFEILLSICTTANTTFKTSFAKIYCQKIRGTGLGNFVTDTQARGTAQSGFNISSISSGTAQGVSGHGLNINVTGGTASTEYTCTALIHVASKNNLY